MRAIRRFLNHLFRSNPGAYGKSWSETQAEACGDSMISIHDLEACGLLDKNHTCVDSSCPLYKLPRPKKALTGLSFFEICDACKTAMNVRIDDPLYDLSRRWMEESERTGDLPPIPREIADRLDRMTIEILGPDSSECGLCESTERPSVRSDQWFKPNIKHLIWHLIEKGARPFNWLHKIMRPSSSVPHKGDSQT